MSPTYLRHINKVVADTCPFTGISGKLPLNSLTMFLTSPDNIYLLIICHHHLQAPCRPAKKWKALCPKPTGPSEPVLCCPPHGSGGEQTVSTGLQFGFLIVLPPLKGVPQLLLLPTDFKPSCITGFLTGPCWPL